MRQIKTNPDGKNSNYKFIRRFRTCDTEYPAACPRNVSHRAPSSRKKPLSAWHNPSKRGSTRNGFGPVTAEAAGSSPVVPAILSP